ncbi:MAG: DUF3558 family protein [Pseudonocardiales bacterium]
MSVRTRIAPLALVFAVAGCSVPEASVPGVEPGTSVPPPAKTSPPPGTTQPTGLAAIEACDLLTVREASSLGLSPPEPADEILGLRRCDWKGVAGGISTTINEDRSINELVLTDASSVTDVTIGRHQAKRALETSGPGYCDVIFAVGDSANVSVLALYLNDTPTACKVADQAAALIEPKLP